jgi:hypothetical protein
MFEKNSLDNVKFLKLIKQLDLIKDMFNEEDIKFNPYLHPDKSSREKPTKYLDLAVNLNFLRLNVYKSKFIVRLLKGLLMPVVYHLYNRPSFKFSNQNVLGNIDTIFVSHYTHKGISALDQDFYFGDLPKRTRNKSSENLVLFINHTRDRSMSQSSNHNVINFKPRKSVLPKTTSNKTFIRIYLNQIKLFYKVFIKANRNSKVSGIQKIFLFEFALQQLSRSAFIQQCLIHNVIDICRKCEPRKIMLTFEGHSYETFLARKIDKSFVNMEISVYQFSIPVAMQVSFFKNLELLPSKTVIYVSGESPAKQIKTLTSLEKNRIQVLGSHKNNKKSLNMVVKGKNLTVLITPEGSRSSLAEFVALLGHCIEALPNVNFILRAHPASSRYALKILTKIIGPNSSKFLSDDTLENDLRVAHICIYKNSVVGIQGLQYGVLPIHFSNGNSGDVDPINLSDLLHPRFDSPKKLIRELEKYSRKTRIQETYTSKNLDKVFNMYLSPIDTKIII